MKKMMFGICLALALGASVPGYAAGEIDINSATKAELMTLKGVGDAIIKGRPYKGKDEISQKGIVTDAVYADIKDKIIAKQK
ncbi:MAG: hypothetical protein K2P80_11420 [Beijerinckiaceae bacterium]|nr:hypothetical protein [Beijerinckiaceae bacterium]